LTALAVSTPALPDLLGLLRSAVQAIAGVIAPERKYAPLASVDVDGRFAGYASLFGRMDLSGDVVERGAFVRSLAERGPGGVRMLLEHDPKAPIGVWDVVEEDRFGLWVEGRLSAGIDAARAARSMQGGALDGLSIGFRTRSADEDRSARVRRLREIDLWEVSVVRTPMLPEARARAHGRDRRRGNAPHEAADAGLIGLMRREAAVLRATR
jgi:uncharacterized protein